MAEADELLKELSSLAPAPEQPGNDSLLNELAQLAPTPAGDSSFNYDFSRQPQQPAPSPAPDDRGLKQSVVNDSALGIPLRFVQALPEALAKNIAGVPAQLDQTGYGVRAMVQGPESLKAEAEAAIQRASEDLAATPEQKLGPSVRGFRYDFSPSQAGTRAQDPEAGTQTDQLLSQLEGAQRALAAADEAQRTHGASVLRDVAMTGLMASGSGTPLAAAAQVGLPAAMESGAKAAGLEGALTEGGQRAEQAVKGMPFGNDPTSTVVGPAKEFVASLARDLIPELPTLGLLGMGLREGKASPREVKPGLEPGRASAEVQAKTAIEKSIERNQAKVSGQPRVGTGAPAEPVAPPTPEGLSGAIMSFLKDPLGPGGDALSEYSLARGAGKALKAGAKMVLKRDTFNKLIQEITPVKDALPPEVRQAFDAAEGLQNLGLTQASSLVNKIARTLPEPQQLYMRNLLQELPRKTLPASQWVKAEYPETIGGPRRPLPPTTENIQRRYGYYYNEASALVDSVLPGKTHPEMKQLVKDAISLQRLTEDLAGLDLTKTYNAKLTKAQLAKLRKGQADLLAQLPSDTATLVQQAAGKQDLLGLDEAGLQAAAKEAANPAQEMLGQRLEPVQEKLARAQRPDQNARQARVGSAEARLAELQPPAPEAAPKPKILEGTAPGPLSGKPLREVRKGLQPPEPPALEAPTRAQVQAFKPERRGFRERTVFNEQGKTGPGNFPSGEVRPAVVPPADTPAPKEVLGPSGEPIKNASKQLAAQIKQINDVVEKTGFEPSDSSILTPKPAGLEKIIRVTEPEAKTRARQIQETLLDQMRKEVKDASQQRAKEAEISRLVDYIDRQKLPSPDSLRVLMDTRDTLQKQIKSLPDKVEPYIQLLQEEQRAHLLGGKGHIRKRYIDDLNQAADDIVKQLNQDVKVEGAGRSPKPMRARTDFLARRQTGVEKAQMHSPTLPLFEELTGKFNLAAANHLMGALKRTAFVEPAAKEAAAAGSPALRDALEAKGWVTLPDSKSFGELAGHTVDPRIANALEVNRSLHADPKGNFDHMTNWMAGNLAAKNPASAAANAMGSAWAAWTRLGIPVWRFPKLLREAAEGVNSPKWGTEIQSAGFTTLTDRPGGERATGRLATGIRKAGMGDWLLDDNKRGNFREYVKEFDKYNQAITKKTEADKLFFKSLTDVADLSATIMRKAMEPVVGKGYATMLDMVKMGEVYSDFEFMVRAGSYIDMRKRGYTPNAARAAVNDAFVDYSNVAPAVQKLRTYQTGLGNRFLQFGATMASQGLHLGTNLNPLTLARFWAPAVAIETWNQQQRKAAGEDDKATEQRMNLSKSWQGYPNRLFTIELWNPETKKMMSLDLARANPYGLSFGIATDLVSKNKGLDGTNAAASFIQPGIAVLPIIEEMYNHRLFYNRPVRPDQQGFLRPWNARATLEHLMESYLPPQYGRNLTTLARQLRGEDSLATRQLRGIRLKDSDLVLAFLSGLKLSEFDKSLALEDLVKGVKAIKQAAPQMRNADVTAKEFPVVFKYMTEDIQRQLNRLGAGE